MEICQEFTQTSAFNLPCLPRSLYLTLCQGRSLPSSMQTTSLLSSVGFCAGQPRGGRDAILRPSLSDPVSRVGLGRDSQLGISDQHGLLVQSSVGFRPPRCRASVPSSWYTEGPLHGGLTPAFRNSEGDSSALLHLLFLKCLSSKQSIRQSMTGSGLFPRCDHTPARPLGAPYRVGRRLTRMKQLSGPTLAAGPCMAGLPRAGPPGRAGAHLVQQGWPQRPGAL